MDLGYGELALLLAVVLVSLGTGRLVRGFVTLVGRPLTKSGEGGGAMRDVPPAAFMPCTKSPAQVRGARPPARA